MAVGNEYWINANTGSDAGAGTEGDPWLTLQGALDNIVTLGGLTVTGDTKLYILGTGFTVTGNPGLDFTSVGPSLTRKLSFVFVGASTWGDGEEQTVACDYSLVDDVALDGVHFIAPLGNVVLTWGLSDATSRAIRMDAHGALVGFELDGRGVCDAGTGDTILFDDYAIIHNNWLHSTIESDEGYGIRGDLYSVICNNLVESGHKNPLYLHRTGSFINNVVLYTGSRGIYLAEVGIRAIGNTIGRSDGDNTTGTAIYMAHTYHCFAFGNYIFTSEYGIGSGSTGHINSWNNRFWDIGTSNINVNNADGMDFNNETLNSALYVDELTNSGRVIANVESLAKQSWIRNNRNQFVGAIQKRQYDAQQYNPFGRQ